MTILFPRVRPAGRVSNHEERQTLVPVDPNSRLPIIQRQLWGEGDDDVTTPRHHDSKRVETFITMTTRLTRRGVHNGEVPVKTSFRKRRVSGISLGRLLARVGNRQRKHWVALHTHSKGRQITKKGRKRVGDLIVEGLQSRTQRSQE